MTPELAEVIVLDSTFPLLKITLIVGLVAGSPNAGIEVAVAASIVIAVVVAETIRPPLLTPALTGSFISITEPGLTTTPASIEVVKVTVSLSFCSANSIARPNLAAWLREVHANAFTCFILTPNFAIAV